MLGNFGTKQNLYFIIILPSTPVKKKKNVPAPLNTKNVTTVTLNYIIAYCMVL